MKVKVKYTITEIKEEDIQNWEESDGTPESVLKCIKDYIQDDPSYIIDGLDKFSIGIELVKEEEKDAKS